MKNKLIALVIFASVDGLFCTQTFALVPLLFIRRYYQKMSPSEW